MRNIRGKFGEVRFQDCIEGMRELQDNAFDLGVTDIPFNINYKGYNMFERTSPRIDFDDDIEDYPKWVKSWFPEFQRVTGRQIITVGLKQTMWWVKNMDVKDFIFVHDRCAGPGSSVGVFAWTCPWIVFGQFSQCYHSNTIEISSAHGKWRPNIDLVHSSPKIYDLGEALVTPPVEKLGVKSLLDPFGGSGWIAEVGESLGLEYLTFEIKEEYAVDIRKRISRGKERRKMENGGLKAWI